MSLTDDRPRQRELVIDRVFNAPRELVFRMWTDPKHLAYHDRNRAAGRPPGLARVRLEYRGEAGDWWELWMPTEVELRDAADAAGWFVHRVIPEGASCLWDLAPRALG